MLPEMFAQAESTVDHLMLKRQICISAVGGFQALSGIDKPVRWTGGAISMKHPLNVFDYF